MRENEEKLKTSSFVLRQTYARLFLHTLLHTFEKSTAAAPKNQGFLKYSGFKSPLATAYGSLKNVDFLLRQPHSFFTDAFEIIFEDVSG